MLTPSDLVRVKRLRACGILMPVRCLLACKATGLPLAIGASILVQETGGGRNEWGHDTTIFVGGFDAKNKHAYGETVTKQAVLAYLKQRGPTGDGGMQGVNVTQLTYYAFQDEAMRLGGLWKPLVCMKVGFGDLAHNIRRSGIRAGVVAYNGTGSAAEKYADEVLARADRFTKAGL